MNIKLLFALTLFAAERGVAQDPCMGAESTRAVSECLSAQVAKAETELATYLDASRRQLADAPKALAALNSAEDAWLKYRTAECDAVYEHWAPGSYRNPAAGRCALEQTRRRTHDLWAEYLTYMDHTQPVLPEPRGAEKPPR